jgi:hypothetical protein
MAMDSEVPVTVSREDLTTIGREHAILLGTFLPLFRLLEVQATISLAIEKSVEEANASVIRYFDAVAQGQIPVDPAVAAWNKFVSDLDDTFVRIDHLAGSNSGKCAATWEKALANFAHEWLTLMDREKRGDVSHASANAARKELTIRMKIATDTYMHCLNIPLRQQVPAGPEPPSL